MQAASHDPSRSPAPSRPDGVSGVGLATIVAALHLAILASRISPRHGHPVLTLLSWSAPANKETAPVATEPPSNPHRTYSVGQLALSAGMAVMGLTLWLHVMRISGSRTH